MANAEDELSAEGLKAYIDGHGGKVKNLDLVAHYSSALKHPKNKAANKKKFSQIVNEVAKVNIIEGEKFLVLKKKYKKDIEKLTFQPPTIDQHESEEFMLEEEPLQGRKRKVAAESSIGLHRDENELPRKVPQGENQLNHQNDSNGNNKLVQFQKEFESTEPQTIGYDSSVEQNERFNNKSSLEEEKVELPTRQPRLPRNQNTAPEFIVPEEEYQQKRIEEIESTPSISVLDTSSQIESVKNVADAFNDEGKNSENSPENSWKQNGVAGDPSPTASERKFTSNAESSHADHHDDDEEPPGWETGESVHSEESNGVHHSPVKDMSDSPVRSKRSSVFIGKLDALERKWMMASAYGKIPELNELLKQDPTLAKKRDFISTVMHWGAKLGKKEMIRMAVKGGVDVNMRTQGGYTALHIAAMHNKEAIMQLLISECEANIEIRDYSGRKPHHHLKSTASSFIKKLIKGGTPDPDERHPAKSLAEQRNKRQSKIGTFFKSQLRSSFRSVRIWGSADDLDSDRLKTRSLTPPKTPPTSPRMRSKSAQLEGFSKDNHLMPPPHPFQNRKSKKKAGRRSRSSPGSNVVARSESDSELMYDSPHTHIIMI